MNVQFIINGWGFAYEIWTVDLAMSGRVIARGALFAGNSFFHCRSWSLYYTRCGGSDYRFNFVRTVKDKREHWVLRGPIEKIAG